jgi:hypothetical protein
MKKAFSILLLTLILTSVLTSCGLTVPKPMIESGEFDFSVTYEYDGERKTVSGVYVCEYTDLSWTIDGGYSRTWSGYIEGNEIEDHVRIDTTEDGSEIFLVLNLNADYFMDDYNFDLYGFPEPYIMVKYYTEDGTMGIIYDVDDIKEMCGASIISYEYDEPVENSFSVFN